MTLVFVALAAGMAWFGADDAMIRLERTACFGACPIYVLSIAADGTVSYTGYEHVREHGTRTWKIAPDAALSLAREMERSGFFDMKDEYTAPVSDMPTTFVTLSLGGRTKRIRDHLGAPQALVRLETRIDYVSGARGRIFVDAAAIRELRKTGWTAASDEGVAWMSRAASSGDAEVVTALLAAGADPRARDMFGMTPMMKAAASGDPATVRALLAAGGDPTARDSAGRNAADRVRDAMANPRETRPFVEATGAAKDYALVLKLLTDE
jgi:hypothetical protein